jgi:hypothetical protein
MIHYLNNIEITPRNRLEIGVVSDFSGNPEILSLNTDSIILPREAKDIIDAHIQSVGIFEGIPYRVTMEGGVSLEYYVDFTEEFKVRQHEVEIKIKRRQHLDDFRSKADGTSFEYMVSTGVTFNSQTVPYFIVKDNQLEQVLQLGIATYMMTKELIQAIKDTAQAIADVSEAAIPVGIPPVPNFGAILRAALKAAAQIVYTAAVLVAVIKLGSTILFTMFPPKKELAGVTFNELLKKACAFLGYTYVQGTISNKWVLCPVPLNKDNGSIFYDAIQNLFNPFNKNYPSSSDTTPTVGAFIQALETMFNARLFVINNVVRIERRDWLQNQSPNQILPALSIQGERDDEYSYSVTSGEIWKRYYLHYQTDFSDLHTLEGDVYGAHNGEYATEPAFPVTNNDMVLIRGLNEVNIPFALASRKDRFTIVELLAKGLLAIVDGITGIFGGGTNFVAQINSRKDAMQISQQFFGVTKVLYADIGEWSKVNYVQGPDYLNFCSANALWDNYHYINAIDQNDWIIKENVRVRLTAQDFVTLLANNFALINSVICEILKIEWIDEKSFAQITYRQRGSWANGKTNVLRID